MGIMLKCPLCKVETLQEAKPLSGQRVKWHVVNHGWRGLLSADNDFLRAFFVEEMVVGNYVLAICSRCDRRSFWFIREEDGFRGIFYEPVQRWEGLSEEISDESVRNLYNEALAVAPVSSRAAAALLRLVVERLCVNVLGDKALNRDGKSKPLSALINSVKQKCELNDQTIAAMTEVSRWAGSSLHAGTIEEDHDVSPDDWFELIRYICEEAFVKPERHRRRLERLQRRDRQAAGHSTDEEPDAPDARSG